MQAFTNWMEKHFVPVAAKIGSQKHLVAIRDSFISIMPITMAGSIATLLNVLVRDLPTEYKMPGITSAFGWLIGINGYVWWGTLAILSAVLAFAVGYHFSEAYDVNPVAGGLVAFASFIITIPQSASVAVDITNATAGFEALLAEGEVINVAFGAWGNINWGFLNTGGMFTALLVGGFTSFIYAKLMNANIIIKLPDEVPPAVSKAFASIVPGTVALYAISLVAWFLGENPVTIGNVAVGDLPTLINTLVQQPFMHLSQNIFSVIIVSLSVSLFWFFGLHGPNVLAPVLEGIYMTAQNNNTNFYEVNQTAKGLPHLWVKGSFDAFSWMGGSGSTFALIIAILVLSKRADARAVATYSLPMGIFNINEPVIFGLPIVLNPIYFIPFLLVPTVQVILAYGATAAGLIPPVHITVPWVIPPVIYAWLATGFSFAGALMALVNILVGVGIWGVFVVIANNEGATVAE